MIKVLETLLSILDALGGRLRTGADPASYSRPFAYFTPSDTTLLSPTVRYWEVSSIAGGSVLSLGCLDPDGVTAQTITYDAVYVGQKIARETYYLRAATTATVIAGY